MKTFLVAIAVLLLNTTFSTAQTIGALTNSNGLILTASTRAVPPVNVVTFDELVSATSLTVIDEKTMKPETGIAVKSFSMTAITTSGNITLETKGAELSKEMKLQLQQLKSGDKVYFEYIKGIYSDETVRALPSMAFKVQ